MTLQERLLERHRMTLSERIERIERSLDLTPHEKQDMTQALLLGVSYLDYIITHKP